jgi:hypothetical protein
MQEYYQEAKNAQAIVLETIDEFSRFKRIDKRFLDRLKEKNLNAYFIDSYGYKIFRIGRWINGSYEYLINVHLPIEIFKANLSIEAFNNWQFFKEKVKDTNYDELIKDIKDKIDSYEQEEKKLKELIEQLRRIEFKNFHYDIHKAVRDLENAIR